MNIVIIGAGKAGRGFLARILKKGNMLTFIDNNKSLINELKTEKHYEIVFFGEERASEVIDDYYAYESYSKEADYALSSSDLIFVSVGAGNFPDVSKQIALSLSERETPVTIVTAENAISPADKLSKLIQAKYSGSIPFEVTEAAIFCSTLEKSVDCLDIISEDRDYLPYASKRVKDNSTISQYLEPEPEFDVLLQRKIYTYNCSSALIAYLGWYCGYESYADSANDKNVEVLLDRLYQEVNEAIETKYGVSKRTQEEFSNAAKNKFQNKLIRDTIERNAREAGRKLAKDERLIGPMLMMQEVHRLSRPLALTIAVAIKYGIEHEKKMADMYAEEGLKAILANYCSVSSEEEIAIVVKQYFSMAMENISLPEIIKDMETPRVLIFGAGKIARGFIGDILARGDLRFKFVDYNQAVVDLLNERRKYSVHFLCENPKIDIIEHVSAWSYGDSEKIIKSISNDIDTVFISVGGKNLPSLKDIILSALHARMNSGNKNYLNIILCENWIKPADIVHELVYEDAEGKFLEFIKKYVGISESVVMRSGIEPTKQVLEEDPLAVNVNDFWYFPVDVSRIKGSIPVFPALHLINDFDGYIDRKFYTYNAANATVSYMGSLMGYTYISDAAWDPRIMAQLEGVYEETGHALCKKHGFDYDEHFEFTRTSLNKVQNRLIVDYCERNARDPIRKLGPKDRLIGPARLVVEFGGIPDALCTSIAAALYYDSPSDPIAEKLKEIRKTKGIDYILDNICMLTEPRDKIIRKLVHEKINMLKSEGLIREQ